MFLSGSLKICTLNSSIVKLKRVLNMSGTWIQISVNRHLLIEVSKVDV